jgi:hypothetical protein
MTPKEKAKELYDNYRVKFFGHIAYKSLSKQCVLIAVDEIINSIVIIDLTTAENQFIYWDEVKEEIEKL